MLDIGIHIQFCMRNRQQHVFVLETIHRVLYVFRFQSEFKYRILVCIHNRFAISTNFDKVAIGWNGLALFT